ncbi:hypothetical protein [Pseudoalteromonas sp. ASV78]|uniref:hypothetical protein n=1 Tax=Pseudoalteromonas sp. ASV78 TaxID=3397851 RepID=UPI0039FBFA62
MKFNNYFWGSLSNKRVRCQDEAINTDVKAQYNVATKTSVEFDGHLYNEKVRFILVYFLDGEKKIAFFEDNGFIGNEWSMSPNHMGSSDYKCEDIQKMLFQYGYHNMFTNYLCLENINLKKDLKLAFRK